MKRFCINPRTLVGTQEKNSSSKSENSLDGIFGEAPANNPGKYLGKNIYSRENSERNREKIF